MFNRNRITHGLVRFSLTAVVALGVSGLAACSSDDSSDSASGDSQTSASATTSADASAPAGGTDPSADAPAGADEETSRAPQTGNTKAVCSKVVTIIQTAGKDAITAYTNAMKSGSQADSAAGQQAVKTVYKKAATQLRSQANTATDPALKKQINDAASYFEKAAASANGQVSGGQESLGDLSKTCTP